MKTWCETEANCTDPSVHVRGCYPAEVAGTCYLDYQKINWCARFGSEDKCTRGAVKGLKGEPIQCKWSSEENACNHVEQTPRDKGRPDKGGMEKKPGMRDKDKGMEKQDAEFTGACVSQLSWCFQAGTDENLCKPLVEIGQCAFVEIGDYKGCVAKKESFFDACYKGAEDSEEKCGNQEIECTFVESTDESTDASAEAYAAKDGLPPDVASGAFMLHASSAFALLFLSY